MASMVSGIFDLLGGDPAAKEEGQLGDLAGFESNLGEKNAGEASDYYGDILSGDPSKIAEVLAPEIKAGQEQVQQQAETDANFGNRGGGTNASTQAARSDERGNIINLIGGLQQGAAGAEAGIGENMLGQSSTNIGNEANLAINRRNQVNNDVGGIAQGAAEIATGLPGMFSGSGALPSVTDGTYDPLLLNTPGTMDLSSLSNSGDEADINQLFQ